MAFSAGLKPYEFDSLSPQRVWNVIDAHFENQKVEWERERVTWFYIGIGNSSKNFPKNPQRLHPFPWDQKTRQTGNLAHDIMSQHEKMVERRKQLEKKVKNDRGRS